MNQEAIGCKNKERLETFSYNLEKQWLHHAFFKTAQERFLSHYQEYYGSSEQVSFSSSTSPFVFNLKDTMNNLVGQALPLHHVWRADSQIVAAPNKCTKYCSIIFVWILLLTSFLSSQISLNLISFFLRPHLTIFFIYFKCYGVLDLNRSI